jgi:hypothetical protein
MSQMSQSRRFGGHPRLPLYPDEQTSLRIDAEGMDRLRHGAEKAELAKAVAAIEFLKNKILASPSSAPHQVITSLRAALLACHRDPVRN